MTLAERLEALGKQLGEREAPHAESIGRARARAEELRVEVASALESFERAAAKAGALQLAIEVSTVRLDDKHLRSHEFELQRGRHIAIITVKSRGEVTLVGPFSRGKTEGPCRSFPLEPSVEFDDALADFLSRYVEEAATP